MIALPIELTIAVDAPGQAVRRGPGSGVVLAALGVLAFSLTFPSTVWGLESFGPWSLVALRSVLAGADRGRARCWRAGSRCPSAAIWAGLAVVAGGVVVGFPLLTTLALQTSTSSHAAVVVGLLPLTTALFSALRTGSRPPRAFWVAALAGAAVVIAFTVQQSGGKLSGGDLYLFGALLVCAAGYTEGGRLAGVMPGWQVIGWALVLALPLAVAGSGRGAALRTGPPHGARDRRAGLGGRRVDLPRAVRLVPGHGGDRRPAGQPAPAGAAAADAGLVVPRRSARRCPPPRRWRRWPCWSASPSPSAPAAAAAGAARGPTATVGS